MIQAGQILLASLLSFISLFIIAKLLGKKQIAELDFIDYAVGISIGSISAEWATDIETPWFYYAIALATFAFLSLLVTFLTRKAPFFKKYLQGSPIVLVQNGQIDFVNLKRSKLSTNDLLGLCRSRGYFDLSYVANAVLETNGQLSIQPIPDQKPVVASDLPEIQLKDASIPSYLIIDGKVYEEQLQHLQKNISWLLDKLKVTTEEELKKYLLVYYIESSDTVITHEKQEQSIAKPIK